MNFIFRLMFKMVSCFWVVNIIDFLYLNALNINFIIIKYGSEKGE
jgi:hypothetical protein